MVAERGGIGIGSQRLIGTRYEIYGSDFHSISIEDREADVMHPSREVVIVDKVFIRSNVRILKGEKISPEFVITNSSVVIRDNLRDPLPLKCQRRLFTFSLNEEFI